MLGAQCVSSFLTRNECKGLILNVPAFESARSKLRLGHLLVGDLLEFGSHQSSLHFAVSKVVLGINLRVLAVSEGNKPSGSFRNLIGDKD